MTRIYTLTNAFERLKKKSLDLFYDWNRLSYSRVHFADLCNYFVYTARWFLNAEKLSTYRGFEANNQHQILMHLSKETDEFIISFPTLRSSGDTKPIRRKYLDESSTSANLRHNFRPSRIPNTAVWNGTKRMVAVCVLVFSVA